MTDPLDKLPDQPSDEMSEYLQMFLDETEEQLEDLVEVLLVLEREPDSVDELNEAFRLIHSIKGSSGMMGFDNITMLTHHLESRFEAFRSGLARLDEPTMNLVLRCID
ncbi:MAG: Hpt domain-containing protein, partial [Planctomycetota bacterium]